MNLKIGGIYTYNSKVLKIILIIVNKDICYYAFQSNYALQSNTERMFKIKVLTNKMINAYFDETPRSLTRSPNNYYRINELPSYFFEDGYLGQINDETLIFMKNQCEELNL